MNGKIKWIEASMKAYDLVLKAREEARESIVDYYNDWLEAERKTINKEE